MRRRNSGVTQRDKGPRREAAPCCANTSRPLRQEDSSRCTAVSAAPGGGAPLADPGVDGEQGPGGVLGVQELQARVEAELGGDDREA